MSKKVEAVARNEDEFRDAADTLQGRVLEFCRMLKNARLNVTPGRIIDVFRTLGSIDIRRREEFRLALRVNLASSKEEEEIFDRLFEFYWEDETPEQVVAQEIDLEPRPDDQNEEYRDSVPDLTGEPEQYSADDVVRDKHLMSGWAEPWHEYEKVLRELAERLATRPSRRFRCSQRGERLDLRSTLRKNARYGLEVVDLARSERKIRKTRVVLLCDVSGSMDTYGPFLLPLMFGLQKGLKNSRTVVFSTRVSEVTTALRRQSVRDTLRDIERQVRHWSGGTNIGAALAHLNRRILPEGGASSTVCVIISDGYDQGDPAVIKAEMQALRRHCRTVVWINPLIGSEGYAPVTAGMQTALPFIDHFLPAHDLSSLRELCRTLGKV